MKRLSLRLLLTGVSLLLGFASVAWIAGQWMMLLARLPTPVGEFSIRADPQGWLLYAHARNSTERPTLNVSAFDENRNFRPWSETLEGVDADAVWLANALVLASWKGTRLLGLKHELVVLLLALNTIILMAWYRKQAAAEGSVGAQAAAEFTRSEDPSATLPRTDSSHA